MGAPELSGTSNYRRIVPSGHQTASLALTGACPLLMNSGEADREGELYRAYTLLAKTRGKSLDDEANLRKMEWQLRLYLDKDLGPYIPGKNIKEMLRAAATKWKKGEEIKRSLVVVEERIPLVYEGPRDQDGLWRDGYRYTAMVANAGAGSGRVVRCRPMFKNWSLQAELAFDPEELDLDFLHVVVERARKYGLGDYRPTFGAFEATLNPGVTLKGEARGSANKHREAAATTAHKTFVDRIKAVS